MDSNKISMTSVLRLTMTLILLVGVVGLLPSGTVHAGGVVAYVKPSGLTSGACDSWANGCDLQYALGLDPSPGEIWVKQGTYVPGTLRTDTFRLKNGVGIYGGFNGTETLRTDRDPSTNVTILSGDIGTPGDTADNSYHVVTGSGTDSSAVLDGFTITAGNANLLVVNGTDQYGGGLFNESGSPTLSNLIFTANTANYGAGLFNSGSSPSLTNIAFSNNYATRGAGMYSTLSSNPTLMNVTFTDNTAANRGGGMSNSGSSPQLTNVTFSGNSALYGSGISNVLGSQPILTNVTISGNTATSTGGGIYNIESSNPSIINSIIYGNSGGQISNEVNSTSYVTYSIVQGGYTGTGNLDANPLLGPLANNGGFTLTMALGGGSPAIDAGYDGNCPASDQRGVTRPQGSHCDMGAYESRSTFEDVPDTHWAWRFIEGLYNSGVTSGCSNSPMMYCPTITVTRDQMAVFLLRAKHGSNYSPPAATGVFQDVPINHWAAPWIEQLAAEGITAGCGSGNYCPAIPVTRDQMAVFLLRSEHGSGYGPPLAAAVFQDVPMDHWAAAWIEQLAAEGITAGCGGGNYCPTTPVTRDQMAVFLDRAFGIPLLP